VGPNHALTSAAVKQPMAQIVLSNAYRTALVAALKTLSLEVAAEGITVNAIATGRVVTERFLQIYQRNDGIEAAIARGVAGVPMGRAASPEEFAALVTFLCGEPASYVTGQTIAIDGGMVAGTFG
jgi:3-oxoacyl-[acyl-carrier protein] reductase